jgi:hypothetical protein
MEVVYQNKIIQAVITRVSIKEKKRKHTQLFGDEMDSSPVV